jgi:hypothetical protein
MGGSTSLYRIADPARLTPWNGQGKPQDRNVAGTDESDTTGAGHSPPVFYYYGLEIYSTFRLAATQLYMVHWNNRTFLATLEGGTFTLVYPQPADRGLRPRRGLNQPGPLRYRRRPRSGLCPDFGKPVGSDQLEPRDRVKTFPPVVGPFI